jgi:hypothetical protein
MKRRFNLIFLLLSIIISALFSTSCSSNNFSPSKNANVWTWTTGADVVNQKGAYGTEGSASSSGTPGARQSGVTWTDKYGNLWLFGGFGYDANGTDSYLNDLWEFNGGDWIWMGGADTANQVGVYGTSGTAALTNIPGARSGAVSWTDSSGNLWLFGGYGYGSVSGMVGSLNDLWEYTPAPPNQDVVVGEWTWVGGSNLLSQIGTYGTQGVPAPNNVPGARTGAVSWIDTSGNFWLFGGNGQASAPSPGPLNDLWEYSAGQWTWIAGSNAAGQPGNYGVQGTASSSNVPGARFSSVGWVDQSGNLWLFGGTDGTVTVSNNTTNSDDFNDLWEYTNGGWIWISGSDSYSQPGVYGTLGMAATTNVPGARSGAYSWTDSSGNLWLFGGSGYDSVGATSGWLNDLWEFGAGQWTWVSGSNTNGQIGDYGNPGMPAATNIPGARSQGLNWTTNSVSFTLFGGLGYDYLGNAGALNDFWSYKP